MVKDPPFLVLVRTEKRSQWATNWHTSFTRSPDLSRRKHSTGVPCPGSSFVSRSTRMSQCSASGLGCETVSPTAATEAGLCPPEIDAIPGRSLKTTVLDVGSSMRPYLIIMFIPRMLLVTEGDTTKAPWHVRPCNVNRQSNTPLTSNGELLAVTSPRMSWFMICPRTKLCRFMARKSAGVMMVTDAPVSKRTSMDGMVLKDGRKCFLVLA